jgi:hypothetical protein
MLVARKSKVSGERRHHKEEEPRLRLKAPRQCERDSGSRSSGHRALILELHCKGMIMEALAQAGLTRLLKALRRRYKSTPLQAATSDLQALQSGAIPSPVGGTPLLSPPPISFQPFEIMPPSLAVWHIPWMLAAC